MLIRFDYSGSVAHLSHDDRKQLVQDLKDCTFRHTWDYFDVGHKQLSIGGTYNDQDGYIDTCKDIEYVLEKYEIDWTGDVSEIGIEPGWDKMPGGHDYDYN